MKISKDISVHKPPYTVVVIDATDAYYYADVMGEWKTFDTINDLSKTNYIVMENNYFRLCLIQHGMQPESMFVNVGR